MTTPTSTSNPSHDSQSSPTVSDMPAPVMERSDLYDMWLASLRQPNWVLENLVTMGDQVILAGAPKSYKSFWMSHLAVALSLGKNSFLLWNIPKPRKVLFFSLEMREGLAAKRIVQQIESCGLVDFQNENEVQIRRKNLIHIFSVNGKSFINILQNEDFSDLSKIINQEDPDVVIFDSFIRFHQEDENSNPLMSKVMQRMRETCRIRDPEPVSAESAKPKKPRYRTSFIIHHSRKEPGGSVSNYSAAAMRGASSIHSEADLVISTFPLNREKEVSMNFSARKVISPEYEVIGLNEDSLLIELREKKGGKPKLSINQMRLPHVLKILEDERDGGGGYLRWSDIQKKVCETQGTPDYKKKLSATTYAKAFINVLRPYCDEEKAGGGSAYRLREDVVVSDLLEELIK